MNIKEKIGQRILIERKSKGLTRKALAELTNDLKQSRINNWERGYRTPGPAEIKQLAKALDISPAYLMCLTDEKEIPHKSIVTLVPLLNLHQACDPVTVISTLENETFIESMEFIPISLKFAEKMGKHAFAIKVCDDSMSPALMENDILIIDPDTAARPGSWVVVQLASEHDVVVRKFRQLSASKEFSTYELMVDNPNWANIKIESENQGKVIGVVTCVISYKIQ